jgi:D-threonate/D-erythronate kinase
MSPLSTAAGAPRLLGLVADDLTGAADAAAGFAERGWRVVLHLGRDLADLALLGSDAGEPTVLALATHARAQPDEQAATATRAAVTALARAGAERLFVKIDSTVRGSVAGQVDGALAAWTSARTEAPAAVVCPAFPALGRTVEDGVVRVHGVPASAGAARTDPVTPLTTSTLAALLPGAVRSTADALAGVLPRGARLLVDAATDADLDLLAARVDEAGPAVVAVGSGGLAAALGRRWRRGGTPSAPDAGTGGPVLVAVSSLHPVTAGQLAHLAGRLAAPSLVLTTGADLTAHPDDAARALARQVAADLARRAYGALVLVGGDGAAAVLEHLGAAALVVDGTVLGGCPTGVVRGGVADGLRVVTKSGGFGEASALAEIVARLEAAPSLGGGASATDATREPAPAGLPHPTLREDTP